MGEFGEVSREKHFILPEERALLSRELGSIGLYDATLDLGSMPNPPEAPQRWAENPCIIPSED